MYRSKYWWLSAEENGGAPSEEAGNNDSQTGNEPGPNLSDEDTKLLKAVGIDPKTLSPDSLDQVLTAVKKGKHFKDKADEAEKRERELERARKRKERELAQANLVDDDGNVDFKSLKSIQEQAARAEELESLLPELARHVPEHIKQVLSEVTDPKEIAIALKYLQPAQEKLYTKSQLEEAVAAAKQGMGVNTDDRTGTGTAKQEAGKEKPMDPALKEFFPDEDPKVKKSREFLSFLGQKKE